jgi:histidine triad (HIT) family protein
VSDDCVFCRIVRGESPASIVHEDADLVAFLDIRPVTTGHLLVIPKRHSAGLADLDDPTGTAMWTLATRMAGVVRRSSVPCEGVNFFLADGETAGQEVWHVHLHVIPRTADDGFGVKARWRWPERPELDATAAALRAALP